jgi:hypothetical protein
MERKIGRRQSLRVRRELKGLLVDKLTFWILPLILYGVNVPSLAQSASTHPLSQEATTLADTLRHPEGREVHIFYIHGIGSDGPNDYDSLALRKSLCDYLKDCTTPTGSEIGAWDYADRDEFALDAPIPKLEYIDEQIWKNQEEWRAAAPYAIHFQIARSTGPTFYVDELNWWPLTFSLKCRQIIASDARLLVPGKTRIETCSHRESNRDVPLRFKSFDWITQQTAVQLLKLHSKAARVNRIAKNDLLDWGFADAVMALGPLRTYILDGIRQLILKSLVDSSGTFKTEPAAPRADQEFIIVSHSLGSYLIFSALDIDEAAEKTATVQQSGSSFKEILERTSSVYFFANQLRLLELVALDGPSERNIATHLDDWAMLRCKYLKSLPGATQECKRPRITALNDPSDLLTWTVPSLSAVDVENYSVKNATHWFWLFENPTKAHNNYATDKRAIKEMLKSDSDMKK